MILPAAGLMNQRLSPWPGLHRQERESPSLSFRVRFFPATFHRISKKEIHLALRLKMQGGNLQCINKKGAEPSEVLGWENPGSASGR